MSKSVTVVRLLAAALLTVPLYAHAVGLGKLTVLSALGQPLNAEVQIVALQPGEEDSLKAALASPAAFSSAGIQLNPVLLSVKFAIEHRGDQLVLHLSTVVPINDPFLDALVELQWTSGRLVREYTFLLDPPNYGRGPQPIAATPLPQAAPPQAEAPAPMPAQPEAVAPAAAGAAKPAETYEVKKGDTLGEIARKHLGEGVTLNQMLIALYRANKDAFIHENINLVRAGSILDIPSKEAAAEIDPDEARRVVMTHMHEFAEYRRKLAAAVAAKKAQQAPSERSATGQITEQKAEAAPPEKKDHLKLSKAESKHPSSALSKAAKEDNTVALQQALSESQSRVADLEKNVSDLKNLLDLKNAELAQLEKKTAAAAAAAAATAAKPAQAPAAVPAPAPKPVASTPKPPGPEPAAPKPAMAPKPATPKPAMAPKPMPVAPRPEPSFVDEFLGNQLALGGLGAVVVLLAGYGMWAWRRKKAAQSEFSDTLAASGIGGPSALGIEQQGAAGVAPGVSQLSVNPTGLGPTETEEVDPIAEADVYMAYGRDAQAEEILKEALQKDPNRAAIHAKLLEIFANRRDVRSFEQAALKLKDLTHGSGPEWDKVAKLGRSIDPQNPAYAGGAEGDTVRLGSGAAAAPAVDFDLGGSTSGEAHETTFNAGAGRHEEAGAPTLDFDLGTTTAPIAAGEKTDFAPGGTLIMGSGESKAAAGTIDFDLGALADQGKAGGHAAASSPGAARRAAPAAGGSGPVDFDFNLDLGGAEKSPPSHADAPTVDLSAINLDLGPSGGTHAHASNADPKWQEVATKLDLAKAYEEMGDKDGARELLNEALKEGDAAQQGQARQMLASLG